MNEMHANDRSRLPYNARTAGSIRRMRSMDRALWEPPAGFLVGHVTRTRSGKGKAPAAVIIIPDPNTTCSDTTTHSQTPICALYSQPTH